MSAVRAATFWAATGGVVTTRTSVRGSIRARPIWMSPVPGGMSMSRKSRSPQWTSSRNCWTARFKTRPRHMMACSSSARKPMDSTRRFPAPMRRSSGTIFLSRASTSPCIPRSRGTLKPQMSASSTPTVRPRRARATARFTVTELLPTPPLPEAMATTRADSGTSVAGGSSRAIEAGPGHDRPLLVGVHHPGGHGDRPDPVEPAHVEVDVALDLGPQRAPGDGQGHLDLDLGTVDPDPGDHAEFDDVGAQLGIHDVAQRGADLLLRGGGAVDALAVGPGHNGNCSGARRTGGRRGAVGEPGERGGRGPGPHRPP